MEPPPLEVVAEEGLGVGAAGPTRGGAMGAARGCTSCTSLRGGRGRGRRACVCMKQRRRWGVRQAHARGIPAYRL